MEEVRATYEKRYDPKVPVLCTDERPVPLLKRTRLPTAATTEHAKRVDYGYERVGTAAVFLFPEPPAGWRDVAVRERKTKIDWAIALARSRDGRYAECVGVISACDNRNTHTKGAFSEAFEPERARALVRRIEFCHTPKHGSWLNIAENEVRAFRTVGSPTSKRCERKQKRGRMMSTLLSVASIGK